MLSPDEVDAFISQQIPINTKSKTKTDIGILKRWLIGPASESREIQDIPGTELDKYLQSFYLTAKKPNGDNYEPSSLRSFAYSFDRYLSTNHYGLTITQSGEFKGSRDVLAAKLKQLKSIGKGRKPNQCEPLSFEEEEPNLYATVVEDVISNVREAFLDEGVDEQVLQELKQIWMNKLEQSKALDTMTHEPEGMIARQFVLPPQQNRQVIRQTMSVPIQIGAGREISPAAATATMALPGGMLQQQIAALSSGQMGSGSITLQRTENGQLIAVRSIQPQQNPTQPVPFTLSQPGTIVQAGEILAQNPQQPQIQRITTNAQGIIQLDGANDSSSDEDDDYENDDNDDEDGEEQNEEENELGEEENPLNSNDDVSEDDPDDVFYSDNIVVCQYDKINRNKNKWKFHLKDGIMSLNGKDYVFQKANGEAEW